MGLFSKLLSGAEKSTAKNTASTMKRSYKKIKKQNPDLTEKEVLRKTVSTRSGSTTKNLLENEDFWKKDSNISLESVVRRIVMKEYRGNSLKTISAETMKNLIQGISEGLE